VWQRRIARLSHATLYTLLIFMPLTGFVRVQAGGFPIEGLDALGFPPIVPRSDALAGFASTLHFYGRIVLVAVILLTSSNSVVKTPN
jgi:cytochrome b561